MSNAAHGCDCGCYDYQALKAECNRYRAALEQCHRILGYPSKDALPRSVTRIVYDALGNER